MTIVDEPNNGRKPGIDSASSITEKRDKLITPATQPGATSQEQRNQSDEAEQDLQARLDTVQLDWTPAQREKFLGDFIRRMVVFTPDLGGEGISGWLEALRKKWKKCKFTPPAVKTLREMLVGETANLNGVEAALEVRGKGRSKQPSAKQFVLIDANMRGASDNPAEWGILEVSSGEMLTNFGLVFDRKITVEDEFSPRIEFKGTLTIFGQKRPFEITTDEYASDKEFRAAIYSVAGPEARVPKDMNLLRDAVGMLSQGKVNEERRSTSQGWDEQGTAYRVQGGEVTASGFVPVSDTVELRVDLQGEELARNLNLQPLDDPAELAALRRHVVDDLLRVHDRGVTYPMLGAVGAALLHRFAGDVNRFAVWLTGLTGSGKSFIAQLFMNFFGRFRPSSGAFATWASTANFIQRQGYFFKDALYLVDDYKPDVVHHNQVVRVLQAYADNTGRGRLKSDATTNPTRPIRGLLVSTGEDIPEHSSSALARSVVIEVPQQEKDIGRGQRCVKRSASYAAVTIDFLRWFLAQGRTKQFERRFEKLQWFYYRGIAGKQNDIRIASNLALLASGFIEMAKYFGDVWVGWRKECLRFVTEDLIAVRDRMLDQTHEQQPSEVFLSTLRELLQYGRVVIEGFTPGAMVQVSPPNDDRFGASWGQRQGTVMGKAERNGSIVKISPQLAMEAIQESLKKQGRPPLAVTQAALEKQLLEDGKLLDQNGNVLKAGGATADRLYQRVRIGDSNGKDNRAKCITLPAELVGGQRPPRPAPRPWLKQMAKRTKDVDPPGKVV